LEDGRFGEGLMYGLDWCFFFGNMLLFLIPLYCVVLRDCTVVSLLIYTLNHDDTT
jgi:hypothetical protein